MIKVTPFYECAGEWFSVGNIFTKGYAILVNGDYLDGKTFAEFLNKIESKEDLIKKVANLNGLFCAMGKTGFGGFAIVDRIRSMPLFYSRINNEYQVSDYPFFFAKGQAFNPLSKSEFLSSGYCLGNKTLFENIYQVKAGSIVFFDSHTAEESEYFRYATSSIRDIEFRQAKLELKTILDKAMHRLIKSVDGKHIAIPLSGGYDSRFILAWLVLNGYKNVSTFTYGKEGNMETLIAKKVTEKLNIPWIPINYTPKMIEGITNDSFFNDYIKFASTACSMPFFQDYPAMREIVSKNLIPSNSLMVSGHSGDNLAGSSLYPEHKNMPFRILPASIFKKHHQVNKISKFESTEILKEITCITKPFETSKVHTIFEMWGFQERQAKFIVNSCRTYRYFGFDIRLPLFDSELFDFFKHLPFKYKLAKKLYKETLKEYFFVPLGISYEKELQVTEFEIQLQQYKDSLKTAMPFLKIFAKKPNDNHCYSEIALQLFSEFGIKRIISKGNLQSNAPIIEWYLKYLEIKIDEWMLQK